MDGRSPMPSSLSIVVPFYNEEGCVLQVLDEVRSAQPNAEIVAVNDGSKDHTQSLLAKATGVKTVSFPNNRGQSAALYAGLHDPADIPRLLVALEPPGGRPVDVALGSRRVAGGSIVGWPWGRHVSSRAVGWFTRFVLGVPVRDGSTGFRAVRLSTFRLLPDAMPSGYAFFEAMLLAVHRRGGRIVEVPITFTERRHGRSKAGPGVVAAATRDLLRLALRPDAGPRRSAAPSTGQRDDR